MFLSAMTELFNVADAGGGQAHWEMYVHHRISGDLCLFALRATGRWRVFF